MITLHFDYSKHFEVVEYDERRTFTVQRGLIQGVYQHWWNSIPPFAVTSIDWCFIHKIDLLFLLGFLLIIFHGQDCRLSVCINTYRIQRIKYSFFLVSRHLFCSIPAVRRCSSSRRAKMLPRILRMWATATMPATWWRSTKSATLSKVSARVWHKNRSPPGARIRKERKALWNRGFFPLYSACLQHSSTNISLAALQSSSSRIQRSIQIA